MYMDGLKQGRYVILVSDSSIIAEKIPVII